MILKYGRNYIIYKGMILNIDIVTIVKSYRIGLLNAYSVKTYRRYKTSAFSSKISRQY